MLLFRRIVGCGGRRYSTFIRGSLFEEQTGKEKKKRGQKLLRLPRRLLQDTSPCIANLWVVNDTVYDARRSDARVAVPWLVSSLTSDGLPVKVTLAMISVQMLQHVSLPCDLKTLLPPGILKLGERKCISVDGTLPAQQHASGLFSKVAPLAPAAPGTVQVIGSATWARAEVERGHPTAAAEVLDTTKGEGARSSASYLTSKMYRHESMSRFSAKWETHWRRINEQNRAAVATLSQMSMKRTGQSAQHVYVVYRTLSRMRAEPLSSERRQPRFTRSRARARNMHGMVNEITYQDENRQLRATALRG